MTFIATVTSGFRHYGRFAGTAPRSEFWWWILFVALSITALSPTPTLLLGSPAPSTPEEFTLVGVWEVVLLLPTLGVVVRRLRDAAFGWGHVFWLLLPVVGVAIIAVMTVQPTAPAVPQRDGIADASALGAQ